MALNSLTIAPARTYSIAPNSSYNLLRPFPLDWHDNTAPIGSMRNRLIQDGLYGLHNWIDYNAPVGSMRNSAEAWPSPYGLYGW
jgi:hypothetical protein